MQLILHWNTHEKNFVIQELDDTHVLINPDEMHWLQKRLDKHQDDLTFSVLEKEPETTKTN